MGAMASACLLHTEWRQKEYAQFESLMPGRFLAYWLNPGMGLERGYGQTETPVSISSILAGKLERD